MNHLKYSLIGLLLTSLFACEEVIDIDLDDSEPRLVIEAVLRAGENDFDVFISETTSYFDNETPAFRNDAEVLLLDNEGEEILIPLLSDGTYRRVINAEPGRTYSLSVTLGETTYLASATVPEFVPIIELEAEFQEETGPFDEGYRLFTRFVDAPGRTNYYRQIFSIDGVRQNGGADLQVSDDVFFNGSELARLPVFQKIFDPGATITIVLQHIDAHSFAYLNSLADIVNAEGGGPNSASAAPGNPNGNWNAEILGYFGAVAADTLAIDLPE